jgi:hypothetical protein
MDLPADGDDDVIDGVRAFCVERGAGLGDSCGIGDRSSRRAA